MNGGYFLHSGKDGFVMIVMPVSSSQFFVLIPFTFTCDFCSSTYFFI